MTARAVRVVAGVAILAALIVVVVTVTRTEGEAWVVESPARYQVGWVVTVHTEPADVTFVELDVDRPWRARQRTRAGADGDAPLVGEQIETETGWFVRQADRSELVRLAGRIPAVPSFDLRLVHSLPAAIASGQVVAGDREEHLGRECQWFVTKDPLVVSPWRRPIGGDETRSCLDRAGRLLLEEVRFGGALARTTEATVLAAGVTLDDNELFGGAAPPPEPASILRVVELDLPLVERDAILVPPVPTGFADALSVSWQQLDPTTQTLFATGETIAHRRGVDILAVTTQRTVGEDAAVADGSVTTGLGPGEVVHDARGATVQIATPGGALLVVSGTVPLRELLTWVETFVAA